MGRLRRAFYNVGSVCRVVASWGVQGAEPVLEKLSVCLSATRGSHEREKKSTKTTKKAQAVTDKAEAKMLPKVAVLAVEPAALCSNESSAGQLREGCRGRHATTPVPGARTCQHMLAIRHAPEVALR